MEKMSAKIENTHAPEKDNATVNTHGGIIRCKWDEHAPLTVHGYLPYFSEFMHSGGLFDRLVKNCPLIYKSNNAPKVSDVLGTMLLSVLSGHTRYSHATSLYGDAVAAHVLGIGKTVSHDSMCRAFKDTDELLMRKWLIDELIYCCEPLLSREYILDIDPTVKVLYGHQECAEIGYNPKKPNRPSHCYHSYFIGSLRLVLDAEVRPGNQTAGCYSHNTLWDLLDNRLPKHLHPSIIRGDIGFGNEETMSGCELRGKKYLFKLKQSPNVKKLIEQLEKGNHIWENAFDNWEGYESKLELMGWSCSRRVIVLRRPIPNRKKKSLSENSSLKIEMEQGELFHPEVTENSLEYDFVVLVTNLELGIVALSQLYRDRGDCENIFDELKNQWGWEGFTTHDVKRTSLMARFIALTYNWWNIFCRLAVPEKHMEAKTSRPMLQQVIGRLTNNGGKRFMHLSAVGAQSSNVRTLFEKISFFLRSVCSTATQLNPVYRWTLILTEAFKAILHGASLCPGSEGAQILLPIA
jgi:hypothetical protein